MSRFRLKRPSPALVVATAALFVALGGTGYAAFQVGTKNIKNGAVTTKKLHNGAVTNSKIANGAVNKSKLNLAGVTVPNSSHANTANTANSATNATNASHANTANSATSAGSAGTAGSANALNGVVIVRGADTSNGPSSLGFATVTCPAGMSVISGGVLDSGQEEQSINETGVESTGGGTNNVFFADTSNISGGDSNIPATTDTEHVWAECIHGSVTGTDFAGRAPAKR